METIPPQDKPKQAHDADASQQQVDASFVRTFESVEALVSAKVNKLLASKDLVVAEAKLSLSAIILCLAICLLLVILSAVIWALINAGLGLIILQLVDSMAVVISLLLLCNIGLCVWSLLRLKRVFNLIGFSLLAANKPSN